MGLVQGLGEFLPISSSGHLVVMPWLLGYKDPGQTFDIALHFGTLLAVFAYFGKDFLILLKGGVRTVLHSQQSSAQDQASFKEVMALVIATIPAAVVGVLLDDLIESWFRSPLLVAINLIVMGAILLMVDRRARTGTGSLSLTHAFWIGVAQSIALFPGVSRSGITITAALLLGQNRSQAARFSFLMSMPIILGACVLKAGEFGLMFQDPKILLGILVATVSGFLSIKYLIHLVKNYSYAVFSYYRFIFGFIVILLYFIK